MSGYFQGRAELWREPIYRDLWGLLREFGDAELASLIAPRGLVVEASRGPRISGPPPSTQERRGATPNGALADPPLDSVRAEVERARLHFAKLEAGEHLRLIVSGDGHGLPGSEAALQVLVQLLGVRGRLRAPGVLPEAAGGHFDPAERLRRQLDQLVSYTQQLILKSAARRVEFWSKADSSSPERWNQSTRFFRDYIWDEVIGRLPPPSLPANPRTRLIYDEPSDPGVCTRFNRSLSKTLSTLDRLHSQSSHSTPRLSQLRSWKSLPHLPACQFFPRIPHRKLLKAIQYPGTRSGSVQ